MDRRAPRTVPDWGQMIDDLLAAGVLIETIATTMGYSHLTTKMRQMFALGIEPQPSRRDRLMALWCETLRAKPANVPLQELRLGKPPVRNLPPAEPIKPRTMVQAVADVVRRKPGRPKKVAA